jgi:hypothetical protein
MNFVLFAALCGIGLFLSMLVSAEVGRRIGLARIARYGDGLVKVGGTAEAAMFALFGLLIAFTFSGAASRFQDRRDLIAEEANAIGTAYLRLDVVPADAQPPLRELFLRYLDARFAVYRQVEDETSTQELLADSTQLQAAIWQASLAAVRRPDAVPQATALLLPALNQMIDITDTREMATQNHPPLVVFLLLGGLSLVCALLVGHDTAKNPVRSSLHTVAFATIISLTVYVIVDLEFPRLGLIRVDAADQALMDLRESML